MQATLGGATPAPVSGSSSANPPSAIPKHHRYSSSRSNSFSSASIVTVKRSASLSSSGTGARNSIVPMRAQSPAEPSVIALRIGRDQAPQEQKRRKSVAIEPVDRPNSDVLGNSHRHSHSTSSSIRSGNTKRNRASSGALVAGIASQGFSPKKRTTGTIDYSPRTSVQKPPLSRSSSSQAQQSPDDSPNQERRCPSKPELTNPVNGLPSLYTTPGLTNDTESPLTSQTVATPSAQTYGADYFWLDQSSPQNTATEQNPILIQSHTSTDPAMESFSAHTVAGAEEDFTQEKQLDQREQGKSKAIENHRDDSSKQVVGKESSGREHKKGRTRERGEKDKKSMLSKALEKANTAVLLDNAQNFEGALDAYMDACRLLQQVTERSSGTDDKRKLNAIMYTYTTRINELEAQIELSEPIITTEKSLPARPTSDDSIALSPALVSPSIDTAIRGTSATTSTFSGDISRLDIPQSNHESLVPGVAELSSDTKHEQRLASGAVIEPNYATQDLKTIGTSAVEPKTASVSYGAPSWNNNLDVSKLKNNFDWGNPLQNESSSYAPAPLSPRRLVTPQSESTTQRDRPDEPEFLLPHQHDSKDNYGPSSWLDTIDENSSRTSSVHSMSSEQGLHRKYLRVVSGLSSNADFDAAFDAAVEAAYDQGLEPDIEGSKARRRSLQPKRETTESIPVRSSEINEISPNAKRRLYETYSSNAEDDEDQLLDEIAQDYDQSFNFDLSTKSALPRESGSSGYSRSTWQSSQVSDRTTAGTSLSTVAEDALSHPISKNAFAASPLLSSPVTEPMPPLTAPPPQTSLPKIPVAVQQRTSSVRNRRLSAQNPKQLKIETPVSSDAQKRSPTVQRLSPRKEPAVKQTQIGHDFDFGPALQSLSASDRQYDDTFNSPPSLSIPSASASSDVSRPFTASTAEQRRSIEDDMGMLQTNQQTFKKNKSSDGLRRHMVLLTSPTTDSGPSLYTPLSSTFMNFSSKRMNETPLTSQRATLPSLAGTAAGASYEGVFLFDTSLSEAQAPAAVKSPGVPQGIEPCPESFLLRPFWLMRNLASTLTHPKGGFLTSRLFVPREVWQVKSMKLKYLEDKIANCDMLTAALGRLAWVDTYDADAVMEELESFEDVLERVQNTLGKRLGSEVGTGGLNSLFKDASASASATTNSSLSPDAAAGSEKAKGYFSSWRKLRQKSSGAPVAGGPTAKNSHKIADKEAFNMSSVPMTSFVSLDRRGTKKDIKNHIFEGPNKDYMSSLARLFEGVQVLDQIARQVEDPGLRGTSQTHVGLELSVRHAAEFFSFYICRFVLADLGILIDKFLKRGTEWVMV